MCSYVTEKAALVGSAKGPRGWVAVDTAHVSFDHPFHAQLDHALMIDFVNESRGAPDRIAVEISADSARDLVAKILRALASGEAEHAGARATQDEGATLA